MMRPYLQTLASRVQMESYNRRSRTSNWDSPQTAYGQLYHAASSLTL